jgi:predicted metalloprotease
MRFRRGARLDPSQVSDRRGMGAGTIAVGGGGAAGLLILLLTLLLNSQGGQSSNIFDIGQGGSDLSQSCRTGEDANQREDCRIVAVINSVQEYWSRGLNNYVEADTVFFTGFTNTGCGSASSQVGPFYCPVDRRVYIDLGFFKDLRERFGAQGGPFAQGYVIAHEYGHHVQNLLGTLGRARSGATGPQSESVRTELQADCFAGMWAKGAVDTQFIERLTEEDIRDGLDAASAVGDDRIQQNIEGRVDPESWTHGSSESRQRWFQTGYQTGTLQSCDTFASPNV